MPINIYAVKHPLVLNWTNHLIHNQNNHHDQQELISKITLALIYEACRNTIQSQTLYIKYINEIQTIWLMQNRPINLICSDIEILQMISKDVRKLIPAIIIHPILIAQQNNQWEIIPTNLNQSALQNTNRVIIIEYELKADKIDTILNHIYNQKITKINICCNKCSSIELDNLGQKHRYIDVYTGYIANSDIQ